MLAMVQTKYGSPGCKPSSWMGHAVQNCLVIPQSQYEALRSQLGMRSDDMVRRIRELGATATPIKAAPGVGRCLGSECT
jgi:hypothetical protein